MEARRDIGRILFYYLRVVLFLRVFFFLCSTKPRRFFMMAYNNDIGLDPVCDPTCLRKQKVGKPSRNAAQPYARQKALYVRTLPGLMDCGKAGPFGLVPGMLTDLQGDQVN